MDYNEQTKIRKDTIYTFIANLNKMSGTFNGDETVVSVPGVKILEAAQFCEREKLPAVYLAYKNNLWQIEVVNDDNSICLEITGDGLSEATLDTYVVYQSVPSL